jgi:hypothetical protein
VEKSVEEYKRLLHDAMARIEDLEHRQVIRSRSEESEDGKAIETELFQDFDRKIEEQKREVKELGEKLVVKERELLELSDTFQEQLAAKENEIELLNEEYLINIAEKEREIKEKVIEIDKLKSELLAKENEMLRDTPTSQDTGPSKTYYRKILESRQEMIALLEVALRNAEETLKTQQHDYDRTIRSLKNQAEDMRDALYKPAVSRAVRNLMVPVRRKKK